MLDLHTVYRSNIYRYNKILYLFLKIDKIRRDTLYIMQRLLITFLFFITSATLVSCSDKTGQATKGKIVISGNRYTEQLILTHIIGEYLKAKTDLDVTVKEGLGGLYILTEGMKQGILDLTVTHTGTCYLNVLKQKYTPKTSPDEIFRITKKMYEKRFNITWMKPLGFNNTYALALRRTRAEELGIENVSDLIKLAPTLSFGSDSEYYERADGYDALTSYYNMRFKKKMTIHVDLMYQAAKEGQVDVITAYSTDPRIRQMDLKVLVDDKHFFPPYYAVPIIRKEVLEANPGLAETINQLGGTLSEENMMLLNGEVNLHKKEPKDVAIQFLKEKGLIH